MENTEIQTFTAKFLYKGIANYKTERVLVDKHIEALAMSFIGIGVIIGHTGPNEPKLNDNDPRIVGRVIRVFLNKDGFTTKQGVFVEADFEYYCDFTLIDPLAIASWDKIGAVSCSYIPEKTLPGGTHINSEYDYEIETAIPDHMAIVSEPRYEKSIILKNSVMALPEDTKIEVESGVFYTLNKAKEFISGILKNSKKNGSYKETLEEEELARERDKRNNEKEEAEEKEEKKDNAKAKKSSKKNEGEDDSDKKDNEKEEEDEKEKKDNACSSKKSSKKNDAEEEEDKKLRKLKETHEKGEELDKERAKIEEEEDKEMEEVEEAHEKEKKENKKSAKKNEAVEKEEGDAEEEKKEKKENSSLKNSVDVLGEARFGGLTQPTGVQTKYESPYERGARIFS